jgi:predicted outer membrane repeat protein
MAGSKRRFSLSAILLPLLFLTMSGLARAAIITVTNLNDTGAGSLRAAITAHASGDTINFGLSGTITINSELPAVANVLTIDGTGQTVILSGNSQYQIIQTDPTGTLTLKFLTLTDSSTAFDGGAFGNDGTAILENCLFSDDRTTVNGGAITNMGTLTVINSTFSGNQAAGDGGAIYTGITGVAYITNVTFSGNTAAAGDGGALYNHNGTVDLKGSILATSTGGNCEGSVAITDEGHNISDDGTCPTTSGSSVNNSTTLHLDPAGLANNGGPTDTIALEPTSEAVEFIPVADCTDQTSPTPIELTNDQRGDPRPDPGNPNFCSAGAFELQTSEDFTLKSERIQIARSSGMNADEVNMALTFITVPNPTCDSADDVLDNGLTVELFAGTCGATTGSGLTTDLDPFVVHTINTQKYGTFFGSTAPETISARMVAMPTPAGACGEWTLNLEVAGLDTPALGLGGSNPFALELMDSDMHSFGCFDITNAIVGTQIDPPTKTVRREVRR